MEIKRPAKMVAKRSGKKVDDGEGQREWGESGESLYLLRSQIGTLEDALRLLGQRFDLEMGVLRKLKKLEGEREKA